MLQCLRWFLLDGPAVNGLSQELVTSSLKDDSMLLNSQTFHELITWNDWECWRSLAKHVEFFDGRESSTSILWMYPSTINELFCRCNSCGPDPCNLWVEMSSFHRKLCFFPQIAITIGVLTSNRGGGRRTTLADWTWHHIAIAGCSGRGAIAGHCRVAL